MIIDFHTHCFPDALAPRAMGVLTQNASSLSITPTTDGTADGLIARMRTAGIDRAVVCNIATNAHQMHKVNDFALETLATRPQLIPLGSLHPQGEDLEGELERLHKAGIRGIKIHPDYIRTELDASEFEFIFALCEAKNIFVITHAGLDPVSPDHLHCTPAMVRRVMDKFPKLKLVVAHGGGVSVEAETAELLGGQNVYMDTSLLTFRPDGQDVMRQILTAHDPDKLLFATDTPWSDNAEEITCIRKMKLGNTFEYKIFSGNAAMLLAAVGYKGYGI